MKPRLPDQEQRSPSQNEKEKRPEKETVLGFALQKNAIKDWLLNFAECVRDRDYVRAGAMFCANVCAFDTGLRATHKLDELMRDQWHNTWEKSSNFEFNFEELDFFHDSHLAHVAVTWSCRHNRFGAKLKRGGRASLLLVGNADNIKCAASHFSLDP